MPPYLKRNRCVVANKYLSKSIDSAKPKNAVMPQFITSNTQKVKGNAFKKQFIKSNSEDMQLNTVKKFKSNSNVHVSYQVFRNEVENKRISSKVQSINQEAIGTNSTPKRNGSPDSQISTGSTPNSVGTVRAISSTVIVESCKKSATTFNTNIPTSSKAPSAKTNFSCKLRNIIKKNKNDKKIENKENIPTPWKNAKREFIGTTKSIFRAHTTSDSSPLSKTKLYCNKSSVKLPNIKSSSRLLEKSSSSLMSKKVKDDEPVVEKIMLQRSPSDTVIVLESYKDLSKTANISMEFNYNKPISKNTEISDEMCSNQICMQLKSDESLENSIKKMLEEKLNSIFTNPDNNLVSDTSFFGDESFNFNTSSPISFKTVVENNDSSTFKLYLEEAINNSFKKVTSVTSYTDAGKSEIKSLESICSSSKQSEYFLADNQLELFEFSSMTNEPSHSVQGLFERRDQNIVTVQK